MEGASPECGRLKDVVREVVPEEVVVSEKAEVLRPGEPLPQDVPFFVDRRSRPRREGPGDGIASGSAPRRSTRRRGRGGRRSSGKATISPADIRDSLVDGVRLASVPARSIQRMPAVSPEDLERLVRRAAVDRSRARSWGTSAPRPIRVSSGSSAPGSRKESRS